MVRAKQVVAAASIALAVAACAGRPSEGVLLPDTTSAQGTSRVNILVATTRQGSAANSGDMFGSGRAQNISYAEIGVSIPPDATRKIGEVQWPASLPGDPGRNFVTVSANQLDKQGFSAAVSDAAKSTGRNKVLVFVHGFNNRFDDAVYRFAQVVHDAKAPGIPILFSWPSRGEMNLRAYAYDRESANYSRAAFIQVLETLAEDPKIKEINILAHSMGNVVALEGLRRMSIRTGRIGMKIKNVMLIAPDVDVDVFRSEIAGMGSARPRFALFVSQDDQALKLSKAIWGGVPRVGEIDPRQEPYKTQLAQEHIEVFDLTQLKGSAHSRAFEDIGTVVTLIKERVGE